MIYVQADNETRSEFGIAVSLSPDESGITKIIIDDVRNHVALDSELWQHISLCTNYSFETHTIESLNLSKEELAEIGENIIIRLLALNNRSDNYESGT